MDKNSGKKLEREIDSEKVDLENQKFLLSDIRYKYFFIFSFILSIIIILIGSASFFNYREISKIIMFHILLFLVCIFLLIIGYFFCRYRQDRGKFVRNHSDSYKKIKEMYKKLKELEIKSTKK